MNALAVLNWIRLNFVPLLILGALIGTTTWGGIQTYRLKGTRDELKAVQVEAATQERERETETAREKAFNEYNKRRTDEDYRAALARAATASVHMPAPSPGPVAEAGPSRSGVEPAACFDGGILEQELTALAREGEALAAAYRACRVWALGLGVSAGAPEGSSPPRRDTGVVGAPGALYP